MHINPVVVKGEEVLVVGMRTLQCNRFRVYTFRNKELGTVRTPELKGTVLSASGDPRMIRIHEITLVQNSDGISSPASSGPTPY